MKLVLEAVRLELGSWSLSAEGSFLSGVHLVSGNVGSGKSTLAMALAGMTHPASGKITRDGIGSLMLSFQFPEYHVTGFTVDEECRSWSLDPEPVLRECRLTGRGGISPFALSRGELKRLHLACLLPGSYDLLILDEPFSSLDAGEKERFCGEISSRNHGITIIFTHEQSIFPKTDSLWEISSGILRFRGKVPHSLPCWEHAPQMIKNLIASGRCPQNITKEDILEAACRT